jgi:hypothetical protein
MGGQTKGRADNGNGLGRISGRSPENQESCRFRVENLLMNRANRTASIVEPCEIAVAPAINVIHARLNENLPISGDRGLTTIEDIAALLV